MQTLNKDFGNYYRSNQLEQATKVKSAGSWIAEVLAEESGVKGDSLPWGVTTPDIGLAEGCLSIWGGWSGHGKSELLGQVMLWMMENHKVAIASLEMAPSETILRMIRQTANTANPPEAYKVSWMDWANSQLFIYDAIDRVSPESMYGMAMYCVKELGVKHIVIDSLTKCGISKDDLSRQATFVDTLQNIAKNTGLHIHLVTHLRKGDGSVKHAEPGKDDVRGAGEITDLADNVFMVYRNKYRDQLMAEGVGTIRDKEGNEYNVADMWTTKLKLVKNRQTGIEMDYKLWRQPSGQYTDQRGKPMLPPFRAEAEENVNEYRL